ncbi:c-type cytochrome [Flavobacterium oreochromis]|uniref:Cytochrome C n=2 Tax=Flavobacterium TaxID=237 RepID=A0A2D0AI31_9FLAO|nr:cytochrome c [Flavobacterium oreochromis]OWP77141.1 cytochrome C [Flavobacterium oreochromis]OWP79472.1 cytochrome C [Flavobacterium oreochromis]POR28369.1 cytochrome C [Flavobacterium columnare]QYS85326.1 c-type cytochrome [Flavobacterium oreochromis]
MKRISLIILGLTILFSCGKKDSKTEDFSKSTGEQVNKKESSSDVSSYDPNRGEGKFDKIELGALDPTKATDGEKVSAIKCVSCHKTTDEKLVGPGWKGVTERRKPEWIMNFITNPDPMIDKDPELQAQLEICLVRMPNQGLTDDEARNILEYMRKNDGVK